jgi:hypothetical protein
MAKPAKISPGANGLPAGKKLRIGYQIHYGKGAEAHLEIVLPDA